MKRKITIKINGIDTEIMVHYYIKGLNPIIVSMHDLDGNSVHLDLLDELSEVDHNIFIDRLLNNY
jgi:hypothetical protein